MNDSTRHATVGSKKILVLDDTATVADLIREMLLSLGHQVELCHSVDDALGKFTAGKYDLLIADYLMPGMNGVEFARVIRQRAPQQLILLITGSTFSMQEAGGQALPIDGILQKPFSVAEFEEAVNGALRAATPPPSIIPPAENRPHNHGNQPGRDKTC